MNTLEVKFQSIYDSIKEYIPHLHENLEPPYLLIDTHQDTSSFEYVQRDMIWFRKAIDEGWKKRDFDPEFRYFFVQQISDNISIAVLIYDECTLNIYDYTDKNIDSYILMDKSKYTVSEFIVIMRLAKVVPEELKLPGKTLLESLVSFFEYAPGGTECNLAQERFYQNE